MKTAVLIGGAPMYFQQELLRRSPRVIVATPGRLTDHLERRSVSLSDVRVLVLDEADRMLDMGFAPQIAKIVAQVPRERQTLLFSATMPAEIVKIATAYMKLPIRVETARSGTVAEKITHELFIVKKESKGALLDMLLKEHRGSVLLFARTRMGARKITRSVRAMGHSAAEIHSDRSLGQRKEALEGFKVGRYRVLIATDIASRGIDVKGIELVINYDLPEDSDNYVHRIGRTGRAGLEGKAISFATPDQESDIRAIERLTQISLKVLTRPELPKEQFSRSSHQVPYPFKRSRQGHGPRPGQGSGGHRPHHRGRWR